MNRIPDITERPWYTAAQPYRDPNAPDMLEDNNIHIDNIIYLYEHSNDTIPVLKVRLSDKVIKHSWDKQTILHGHLDNVYFENGIIHFEVTTKDGAYGDSFPPGTEIIYHIPF